MTTANPCAEIKLGSPYKDFLKTIERLAGRYSRRDIFSDFVECAFIGFKQAVSKRNTGSISKVDEDRYHEIRKRYDVQTFLEFPKLLGCLQAGIGKEHADFLGRAYMELEISNDRMGQAFTPFHVSLMMAKMTLQGAKEMVARKGIISIDDPACGSGVMAIAAAEALVSEGVNPRYDAIFRLTDLDPLCARMAYIQTTLLWIPAAIICGNSLSLEVRWSAYNLHVTPAILEKFELADSPFTLPTLPVSEAAE